MSGMTFTLINVHAHTYRVRRGASASKSSSWAVLLYFPGITCMSSWKNMCQGATEQDRRALSHTICQMPFISNAKPLVQIQEHVARLNHHQSVHLAAVHHQPQPDFLPVAVHAAANKSFPQPYKSTYRFPLTMILFTFGAFASFPSLPSSAPINEGVAVPFFLASRSANTSRRTALTATPACTTGE